MGRLRKKDKAKAAKKGGLLRKLRRVAVVGGVIAAVVAWREKQFGKNGAT